MDHPETVVAALLHGLKEVRPLVPEGRVVEEDILVKIKITDRREKVLETWKPSWEDRLPKLRLERKYSPGWGREEEGGRGGKGGGE